MERFYQNLKFIIPASIGLACLFHIIIGEIFVFKFSLRKESLKPEFVFLGAVLDRKEFQVVGKSQDLHNSFIPFQNSQNEIGPVSSEKLLIQKPRGLVSADNRIEKNTPRSTFVIEDLSDEKKATFEDIGIDLAPAPSYNPLRLQSHD